MLFTYQDAVQGMLDFIGSDSSGPAKRDARRAVQDGLRELANFHPWNYYRTIGRLTTVAQYQEGTVEYLHSSGAFPRQLTVSGGNLWPAWTRFGSVLIDNVAYDVAELKTANALQLSVNSNPGDDIAAGTDYTLYRDTFPMPINFGSMNQLVCLNRNTQIPYFPPHEFLADRQNSRTPGQPQWFTLVGDPNYQGQMALRLNPAPSAAETFDYVYRRHPRKMVFEEVNDGNVSCTGLNAIVTGTGTAFSSVHVGSVIRLAASTSKFPTGDWGDNPAIFERVVMSVTSATRLTVDHAITQAFDSVKYVISDPVDIEPLTMQSAYKRSCEKVYAHLRHSTDRAAILLAWRDEMLTAMASDSRIDADGVSGEGYGTPIGSPLRLLSALSNNQS